MSEVNEYKGAIIDAAKTPKQDFHLVPTVSRWVSRTPRRGEIQAGSFSLHSCGGLSDLADAIVEICCCISRQGSGSISTP